MAKAPEPNYTQSPNVFFDKWLREIDSLAELKVVMAIVRNTFGWHEKETQVTFDEMQQVTGLSRGGLNNGLKMAMEHGYVERIGGSQGKACTYRIPVQTSSQNRLVTEAETSTQNRLVEAPTSSQNRLELVHGIDHFLISKEKKKKESSTSDFLAQLKTNPAYSHVNFEIEINKMRAWLALPANKGRQMTPKFVLNWINRIERPLEVSPVTQPYTEDRAAKEAAMSAKMGRRYDRP